MIKFLSVLLGIIFSVVIFEFGLRIAGIGYPLLYQQDAQGVVRHRPGVEGVVDEEAHVHVRINSQGLRDHEHDIKKPADTIRIAVLGDSYAQALQVRLEDTFWSVMGRELAECQQRGKRRVEVINFGVSGYGTGSQYIQLQADVWQYEPDIVLLAFLTGNDVVNNSFELERNPRLNYFELVDGKLLRRPPSEASAEVRNPVSTAVWRVLVDHSRIFQVINRVRMLYRGRSGPAPTSPPLSTRPGQLEAGIPNQVYFPPAGATWESAWAITEALLDAVRQETEQRGSRMFLATLSNGIQVHADVELRRKFERSLGVADLLYPDRRVNDWAQSRGVPATMLVPPLAEWAVRNSQCLHGFPNRNLCTGHWNEHGHRVAGQHLAAELCRRVLPSLKSP